MSPLPPWASCEEGRAILANIIAEQPDFHTVKDVWRCVRPRRYHGDNARQLRALKRRKFVAAMDAGMSVDDQRATFTEEPDELIERVLADAALTKQVARELTFTMQQARAA